MRKHPIFPSFSDIDPIFSFQPHIRQTPRHGIIARRQHHDVKSPLLPILRHDSCFRKLPYRIRLQIDNLNIILIQTFVVILLETASLRAECKGRLQWC